MEGGSSTNSVLKGDEPEEDVNLDEGKHAFQVESKRPFNMDHEQLNISSMFAAPVELEEQSVKVGSHWLLASAVSREQQHLQPQTGLLLWDSSKALALFLEANPGLTAGRTVLELGGGCLALASLFASQNADIIVATDGDEEALGLLKGNLQRNRSGLPGIHRVVCEVLRWGLEEDETAVAALAGGKGYDLILGADVVYVEEAIPKLFATVERLMKRHEGSGQGVPILLLCHLLRRVSDVSILKAAAEAGLEERPDLLDALSQVKFSSVVEGNEFGPLHLMCFGWNNPS